MLMSSRGQGQAGFGRRLARIWRIAGLVLVPYLIVLLLLMIFEESFIFFPYKYDGSEYWQPPGLTYEDVFFEADDGTKLHGWYCPHESPRAVVLFAHGNAGNITHRADVVRRLQRLGLSVFLFDYRGYGRSEGRPDEDGILADARAARSKLAELAGVSARDIVLMGRSLGGAVAVDLAAEQGARGLVVESTFSSMGDVAAVHYPWLPVRLLLRTRLDSVGKIANYAGPLLQSHGELDGTIPYHLGRQLYDASPAVDGDGKQFYTVQNADHNDPQPAEYYELLDEFIGKLP
jgi:fermentation-respiration switch protein FrsA (DUF1100 family)